MTRTLDPVKIIAAILAIVFYSLGDINGYVLTLVLLLCSSIKISWWSKH